MRVLWFITENLVSGGHVMTTIDKRLITKEMIWIEFIRSDYSTYFCENGNKKIQQNFFLTNV